MKSALITGATGQDGAYLARLLLSKGYRVIGAARPNSANSRLRLEELGIAHEIEWVDLDLADPLNIARVVRDNPVDEFYNLAAISYVGSSWHHPLATARINGMAVAEMLDAVRTYAPATRFYQASTSEMYGNSAESPQNEDTPFHPRSPYGVAKSFAHHLTVNYRESFGIKAACGILFNHESPLRGQEFVTRKITHRLAGISCGDTDCLRLGNLEASRDWGYAPDFVEGMWRILQQEEPREFVLATGRTITVRQFTECAASALGMEIQWEGEGASEIGVDRKTGKRIVEIAAEFFRPAEVNRLQGDSSLARQELGWSPTVDVETLAGLMARADFDRQHTAR